MLHLEFLRPVWVGHGEDELDRGQQWGLLDDESLKSANLGNDHEFLIKNTLSFGVRPAKS